MSEKLRASEIFPLSEGNLSDPEQLLLNFEGNDPVATSETRYLCQYVIQQFKRRGKWNLEIPEGAPPGFPGRPVFEAYIASSNIFIRGHYQLDNRGGFAITGLKCIFLPPDVVIGDAGLTLDILAQADTLSLEASGDIPLTLLFTQRQRALHNPNFSFPTDTQIRDHTFRGKPGYHVSFYPDTTSPIEAPLQLSPMGLESLHNMLFVICEGLTEES